MKEHPTAGVIGHRTPEQKSVLRHKLKEIDKKWKGREIKLKVMKKM